MSAKSIQQLIEYFTALPGVGPRAAGRFVFALMKKDPQFVKEFGTALATLPSAIAECALCFRSIERHTAKGGRCGFCADATRNQSTIMVVEKESDCATAEKSGVYRGLYHVLGGTLMPLDPYSPKQLKIK